MPVENLIALICLILSHVNSASRKLMFPLIAKSYTLEHAYMAEEFVSRGNDVYFIVHEELQIPTIMKKLHGAQIVVFPREAFGPGSNPDEMMATVTRQVVEGRSDTSQFKNWIVKVFGDMCKTLLLENEEALSRLDKIKADVLIASYLVPWKCPYPMSHRLGIPTIPFGVFVEPWNARIPYLPSYVPSNFLPFTDRMSFSERSKNAFVAFVAGFLSLLHVDLTEVVEAYRVYGDTTDIDSLEEKTSLWLYSTHLVLDYPKPTMPNVVAAGGLTTEPGKPLSGDFLDIVTKIKEGCHSSIVRKRIFPVFHCQ